MNLSHDEIFNKIDKSLSIYWYLRQEAKEDRRFCDVSGASWEGYYQDQLANVPLIEANKSKLAVTQIMSDFRRNRVSATFLPSDWSDDFEFADNVTKLFRASEQSGIGRQAYNNAFEESVKGGMGAARLVVTEEDEYTLDNEYKTVQIEPIYDADVTVLFDPDARRQDKSDAHWVCVLIGKTSEAYEEEFDKSISSMPNLNWNAPFTWVSKDTVYIAEFFIKEETNEKVHIFVDQNGLKEYRYESDLDDDELEKLKIDGFVKKSEKKKKRCRIRKILLDANEILEDCGYIAGSNLPIVPCYGLWAYVDQVEQFSGHIRFVKDLQRLANITRSKVAQFIMQTNPAKPVFDADEMPSKLWSMWQNDSIDNNAFLLKVDPVDMNGIKIKAPLQYTQPSPLPPMISDMLAISEKDIQDIQGSPMEGQKMRSHISGEAISLIQERVDAKSEMYIANFEIFVRRLAEVWLGMAKEVYVEENRKIQGVGADETREMMTFNKPYFENGSTMYRNDMSKSNMKVIIKTGPTTISQRKQAVDKAIQMLPLIQDPSFSTILQGIALMNLDLEGGTGLRRVVRQRLLEIGAVEPTEAEREQMAIDEQNQQPNSTEILLQSESEKNMAQAQKYGAEAKKAENDILLDQMKAKKIGAEILMMPNQR